MKKITKTIIALSVLAGLASCTKEQTITPVTPDVNDRTIALSLTAGQENSETRAAIDKSTSTVINWAKNDKISVFDGNKTNCDFKLKDADDGKSSGTFSGMVGKTSATGYTALYPYQSSAKYDGSKISGVVLKAEQTATAGSFDPEAALMCAQSSSADDALGFKNVVGYVKFTTDFDCSKVALVSNTDTDVLAGTAEITPGDEPAVTVTDGTSSSQISITPASGSGTIAKGTYYIAVMPGTLAKGFKLVFTMTNGTEKYKGSSNSLEIKRNKVVLLGDIKSADLKINLVDLSEAGTANCYLVQKAGMYKFKAVKGNSTTEVGTVTSVEVLWESDGTSTAPNEGDIIAQGSVSYSASDNYIQFSATSAQGNAVIAAKDAEQNIIWSWHIWCAESWEEQTYWENKKSGTKAGIMMDRNLGAITAKAGEVGSLGLLYQWGRKDPFLGSSSVSSSTQALSTGTWSTSSDAMTAENTTQNPMTFYKGDSNGMPDNSWGWTSTGTTKAVNDPCPAGWRVPDGGESGIWAKASGQTDYFSINEGTYGLNFGNTFGSDETIWYPASGYLYYDNGVLSDVGSGDGYYWSVTPNPSYNNKALYLYFSSYSSVNPSSSGYRSCGRAVRCQKIEQTEAKTVVNLSEAGTANCYLVQEAGDYKFKAVKGNSSTSVGDVKSVEVLWESFGTDETPSVGTLIASVSYSDDYIQFSTPSTFKQGNAVIAAKDASNNILWSWHIWCATEKWTEQIYNNSAGTMMDRNLGATSATAGEVGSLGLLYQWGRKDPFLGSSSVSKSAQAASTGTWDTKSDATSADSATQNPMIFYTNYESYGSWASTKTEYDPCPAGWRVPDGGTSGIWAKASGKTEDFSITAGTYGLNFGNTFGSYETIWYPASGCLSNDSGVLNDVGSYGYYWSVTPDSSSDGSRAYFLTFDSNGGVYPSYSFTRSFGSAVRCLQE